MGSPHFFLLFGLFKPQVLENTSFLSPAFGQNLAPWPLRGREAASGQGWHQQRTEQHPVTSSVGARTAAVMLADPNWFPVTYNSLFLLHLTSETCCFTGLLALAAHYAPSYVLAFLHWAQVGSQRTKPASLGTSRLRQIWTTCAPAWLTQQDVKGKHTISHIKCSSLERRGMCPLLG